MRRWVKALLIITLGWLLFTIVSLIIPLFIPSLTKQSYSLLGYVALLAPPLLGGLYFVLSWPDKKSNWVKIVIQMVPLYIIAGLLLPFLMQAVPIVLVGTILLVLLGIAAYVIPSGGSSPAPGKERLLALAREGRDFAKHLMDIGGQG